MTTREEVYKAIESERIYQGRTWNASTTASAGQHSVTEWLVYIQQYTQEALSHLTHNGEPGASQHALELVRKITAMGVSCMEQNGAPLRGLPHDLIPPHPTEGRLL